MRGDSSSPSINPSSACLSPLQLLDLRHSAQDAARLALLIGKRHPPQWQLSNNACLKTFAVTAELEQRQALGGRHRPVLLLGEPEAARIRVKPGQYWEYIGWRVKVDFRQVST